MRVDATQLARPPAANRMTPKHRQPPASGHSEPSTLPTRDDAADPARWLVVYNSDHAEGEAWAEAYRVARGVPQANLCGLSLPLSETIDLTGYHALRDAVLGYLDSGGLGEQVVGLLFGLGVPGYVDMPNGGGRIAVASLLHTGASDDRAVINPLHRDPPGQRPKASMLSGLWLTGRIDGAGLADAVALIERATALMNEPIKSDSGAKVWIEPVPEAEGMNPLFTTPTLAWIDGLDPGKLRVPIGIQEGRTIESVRDDLCYWGWGGAAPPAGFFAEQAGRRGVCVQLRPTDPPSADLRTPDAPHWARRAIDAGYAAAAASSRDYPMSALPQPGVFFEAMRCGWTLAEAWLVCQPFLRTGMQMIGDPLMTISFPKAGYNLYGPAPDLESIDLTQPALRLPGHTDSAALTPRLRPGNSVVHHYLLRRVDHQGREDGGTSSVAVQVVGGAARTPAPRPCWPDEPGWLVPFIDGALRAVALWATGADARRIDRLVLEGESADGGVVEIWAGLPGLESRCFTVDVSLPTGVIRVRWHVLQDDGAESAGPWSAEIEEPAVVPTTIQLYEVVA